MKFCWKIPVLRTVLTTVMANSSESKVSSLTGQYKNAIFPKPIPTRCIFFPLLIGLNGTQNPITKHWLSIIYVLSVTLSSVRSVPFCNLIPQRCINTDKFVEKYESGNKFSHLFQVHIKFSKDEEKMMKVRKYKIWFRRFMFLFEIISDGETNQQNFRSST